MYKDGYDGKYCAGLILQSDLIYQQSSNHMTDNNLYCCGVHHLHADYRIKKTENIYILEAVIFAS